MKIIQIDKKFKKDIKKGLKKQIIEKGIQLYPIGILRVEFSDDTHIFIKVEGVSFKEFRELSDDEIYESGYKYKEALEYNFKRYYPDFTKKSAITVVEFKYRPIYKFLRWIKK